MTDRATKYILFLIALGLWACALRPWLGPSSAKAQGGGVPPPFLYSSPAPPLLSVSANGTAYVVSGGFICAYAMDGTSHKLKKVGQQPLIAAPYLLNLLVGSRMQIGPLAWVCVSTGTRIQAAFAGGLPRADPFVAAWLSLSADATVYVKEGLIRYD